MSLRCEEWRKLSHQDGSSSTFVIFMNSRFIERLLTTRTMMLITIATITIPMPGKSKPISFVESSSTNIHVAYVMHLSAKLSEANIFSKGRSHKDYKDLLIKILSLIQGPSGRVQYYSIELCSKRHPTLGSKFKSQLISARLIGITNHDYIP